MPCLLFDATEGGRLGDPGSRLENFRERTNSGPAAKVKRLWLMHAILIRQTVCVGDARSCRGLCRRVVSRATSTKAYREKQMVDML